MTRSPNGASPAIQSDRVREALNPPPQGWKLVPEEPTEEMLKAAFVAMNATPSGAWKAMKAANETPRRLFDVKMAPRYRAMLSAAPPLEVGEDIVASSATRLDASCAPPESGGQAGGGEP